MKSKHCLNVAAFLVAFMMVASAAATDSKVVPSKSKSGTFSVKTVSDHSPPNISRDISIDDAVVQFLGHPRIEVLFAADTVETFQIDWRRRSDLKAKHLHGYPVIAKGRDLEATEIQIIRALAAQGASYDFLVSKRTRLRPTYLLRFINNSDVVDIILDLQSSQWGFFFKDALVQEDITEQLARPVLMMIFRAVFGQ